MNSSIDVRRLLKFHKSYLLGLSENFLTLGESVSLGGSAEEGRGSSVALGRSKGRSANGEKSGGSKSKLHGV